MAPLSKKVKSKTDKEQDMKLMRKMNPKQKSAFMKADMKMDKALAKKIMYKKAGRGK